MAKYINKEMFLSSMGLVGDETKYGNRDSEHISRSYSTWMGYEIMDSVDDCEDEDAVEVVHSHWCWDGRFRACAKCGSYVELTETLGASFWKFCPFCGSKMDGGTEYV